MNGHVKYDDFYNLHIEVTDTGIGIPKNKIKSIFEPFQQLSPNRIYNKGVGLGLPICKRIIEAMNGNIEVESEEGKGSRFSLDIIFPIGDINNIEKESKSNNVSLRHIKILLVEDDQNMAR